MNRPDFCAELLAQIGDDEDLAPYLDTVFVMEQGNQPVIGSQFFPAAEKALGERLQVLVQGNLGRGTFKTSAVEPSRRTVEAPARVFETQEAVARAFAAGELDRDVVVGVRSQGPRANGMP